HPDRRGLGDRGMPRQHRLDFGRAQALAGDLDGVVRTPEQVPEAVLGIYVRPVAVDPEAREAAPIGRHVALAVTPEAARHARPGLADHELADLAPDALPVLVHDVGRHARQWPGE